MGTKYILEKLLDASGPDLVEAGRYSRVHYEAVKQVRAAWFR